LYLVTQRHGLKSAPWCSINKKQDSKYNFFEDRQVSFLGALRTKIKNGKRYNHSFGSDVIFDIM
jgi:hypothetical protein